MKKMLYSSPSGKFFLRFVALSFLVIVLPLTLNAFLKDDFDIRSLAKKPVTTCETFGGVCAPDKACVGRGGSLHGVLGCVGNKICCDLGNFSTPTPSPLPPNRLEYQGENIKVVTECGTTNSVNIYIVDDGVNEYPDGTWTYLIIPQGEYSYLAYTGATSANSSASVYGVTNPIRGDVRVAIESDTTYVAGIAHGSYSVLLPTLVDPRYELSFKTPVCN